MKEHTALVAALASAALIAGRLLAISRFDVNTAATILQVSGVGTAVAGTALTLLPFALVVLTCLLGVAAFLDPSLLRLPLRADLLFGFSAAATLCLTAVGLVLLTVIFVSITIGLGYYSRRKKLDVSIAQLLDESRLLRIQATVLAIFIALAPIVMQRPWLPVQALSLADGSVTVGYVLGESEGQVAIMSDKDRTVRFVNPDDIEGRTICSGAPRIGGVAKKVPRLQLRGSLLGWLFWGDQTPSYPACPTTAE